MQSVGLPHKVLVHINTILYKFIWQKRCSNRKAFEKVKRKVMEADYKFGGVKMSNVIEMQRLYYLQWMGKLNNADSECWAGIASWSFRKIGPGDGMFLLNCKARDLKGTDSIKNSFWKNALCLYLDYKPLVALNSITIENVLDQQLFNNDLIRFKGKVLYYPKWIEQGVVKVKHLLNNIKTIMTQAEIQSKIDQNPANTMFQYHALLNAIPKEWKRQWLSSVCTINQLEVTQVNEAGKLDTKIKFLKDLVKGNGNDLFTKPTGQEFWEKKFTFQMNETTWLLPRKVTREVRLHELQWKINHNIYPTNILLQKMKVSTTNKCDYCPAEIDFTEHFFFECSFTKPLWDHIENQIAADYKRIRLTVTEAMFGVYREDRANLELNHINHMILVAKMCVSIAKKTKLNMPLPILFDNTMHLRLSGK